MNKPLLSAGYSTLSAVPRAVARARWGWADTWQPLGADFLTIYDITWLGPRGKPEVAIARVTLPCESPWLLELVSFRAYLDGLAHQLFSHAGDVKNQIATDLTHLLWQDQAVGASVSVTLILPEQFDAQPIQELDGLSLDRLDLDCEPIGLVSDADPKSAPMTPLLVAAMDELPVTETLTSLLAGCTDPRSQRLRQAALRLNYAGPQLEQSPLLRWILAARHIQTSPDQLAEQLFAAVLTQCKPSQLCVYLRFLRVDGIEINVFRSNYPIKLPSLHRQARQ